MQIGNIFNSYENRMQESVVSDTVKNDEQSKPVKATVDLSHLKEGTVFKGEILDISGDKVTIELENQLKLPARLQGDISLGVGDQLLFSVKENNLSQVLIKPMFDSLYSAQTQVLEKALDMAGLSPTEKNFSAAKELMEAGLPLDKGNMTRLLSQSMKFPGTSMDTLVSLNKMGIPVNAENIEQFERYSHYQHEFSGDIKSAVSSMVQFSSAFPPEASATSILSFARDMVDMFVSEMPGNVSDSETGAQGGNINSMADSKQPEVQNTPGTVLTQGEQLKTQNSLSDVNTGISTTQTEGTQTMDQTVTKETMVKEFSLLSNLSEKESEVFINKLQQTGLSDDAISNLIKNSKSNETLLQNLVHKLSGNSINDGVLKQIFASDEFKKMFADMIDKSWSLNPKQMKDPKEIDELYERIQKQSKSFEDAIASKGGDGKGFQHHFQNMRQNMSFMEQLNHQMIYAQMPLKLSNQNANSELYVYADKRKLSEKKDGISVMLHLDMDHLGQTDIKVVLTGSNVHARFYLNDQESVDIVTDNISQLAKQLGLRGFSLTDEVVKRKAEESINKVVDEIIDENAERSIKRYTFDARM